MFPYILALLDAKTTGKQLVKCSEVLEIFDLKLWLPDLLLVLNMMT